jgi:glycosyltransferase involved in cell wall biosynthesis
MSRALRVALFPDSYHEANGVALTARAIEQYAIQHGLPFLCVHAASGSGELAADAPARQTDATAQRLELSRGPLSFRIEHDLRFDLLFWRHTRRVREALGAFAPDVLHITGPSDVGQLGAYLGHRLSIPMVGSWHTNLHEFAARRALKRLTWLSAGARQTARDRIERYALRATLWFYQVPRVLFAPNEELVRMLANRTGKPVYLMSRGVDADRFSPARRTIHASELRIGYVGRLSAEKRVRLLRDVEQAAAAAGPVRLVVIGDGNERRWLETHLQRAEFPGVLRDAALAEAYANLDLFVFPSDTDTFGNVILEAMASGVPVVAVARGGPRFLIEDGVSGLLASSDEAFVAAAARLAFDTEARERMGRRARERALQFTWDAIGAQLYSVYATVAPRDART